MNHNMGILQQLALAGLFLLGSVGMCSLQLINGEGKQGTKYGLEDHMHLVDVAEHKTAKPLTNKEKPLHDHMSTRGTGSSLLKKDFEALTNTAADDNFDHAPMMVTEKVVGLHKNLAELHDDTHKSTASDPSDNSATNYMVTGPHVKTSKMGEPPVNAFDVSIPLMSIASTAHTFNNGAAPLHAQAVTTSLLCAQSAALQTTSTDTPPLPIIARTTGSVQTVLFEEEIISSPCTKVQPAPVLTSSTEPLHLPAAADYQSTVAQEKRYTMETEALHTSAAVGKLRNLHLVHANPKSVKSRRRADHPYVGKKTHAFPSSSSSSSSLSPSADVSRGAKDHVYYSDDEARALHVDYNGPRTHPPRNN